MEKDGIKNYQYYYYVIRGNTSKHNGHFRCLNCRHSFRKKYKLQSHEKVCKNKSFCNIMMPSEDTKILELNQYKKSDKVPFIIYSVLQCLMEKIG